MSNDNEATGGDPPGGVSDQNQEESPTPGGQETAGHAPTDGDEAGSPGERSGDRPSRGGRSGGSGEDSQATGHPGNAG